MSGALFDTFVTDGDRKPLDWARSRDGGGTMAYPVAGSRKGHGRGFPRAGVRCGSTVLRYLKVGPRPLQQVVRQTPSDNVRQVLVDARRTSRTDASPPMTWTNASGDGGS